MNEAMDQHGLGDQRSHPLPQGQCASIISANATQCHPPGGSSTVQLLSGTVDGSWVAWGKMGYLVP